MPRGKYVNHKGRNRHFTSPEELEQENDEETSSEEESSQDDDAAAGTSQARVKTKPRAKKAASSSEDEDSDESEDDKDKKKGVASLIEIENPNRAVKKATVKVNNISLEEEQPQKPQLTRKEREQIEKQKARMRYEKLHAAGKTNEAKADLARLALIRQQRAEAAAKREAEKKSVEEKKAGTSSTA